MPQLYTPMKTTTRRGWFFPSLLFAVMFALFLQHASDLGSIAWAQMNTTSEQQAPKALPSAKLIGEGTFRWFGLKVYEAQLWGTPKTAPIDYTQESLWLQLQYARHFDGKKIAEQSRKEMAKIGLGSAAQQAEWENKMAAVFPNVTTGTKLAGHFQPGQGMRFYRNNQFIGEINDPEFALAFISIWLHPKTTAPGLREQLLGSQ